MESIAEIDARLRHLKLVFAEAAQAQRVEVPTKDRSRPNLADIMCAIDHLEQRRAWMLRPRPQPVRPGLLRRIWLRIVAVATHSKQQPR